MPIAPRPLPYVDPEAPRGAISRTMIRPLGTRAAPWFERTPEFREYRATLEDRPGFRWVEEIYARHRGVSSEVKS